MDKSKSFIDYVYNNEYQAIKRNINLKQTDDLAFLIKEKAKEQRVENYTDEDFEKLLEYARQNPEKPFTEVDAKIVSDKLEETKREAKVLLKEIRDKKDHLYNKVKQSSDAFSLSIKNNSLLKRSSNRVFGGNKNHITFDDYITLLEMRKQIQFNESVDLLVEGVINGNVK